MNNKMLQLELWRQCDLHCKFCYIGEENFKLPEEYKLKAIENTLKIIKDENTWTKYDSLGLIGGEFFQGQLDTLKLKEKFIEIIRCVESLYRSNEIDHFWITTTLTKPICEELKNTLNILNAFDNVWICTSYDLKGRFHTEQLKANWVNNIDYIHKNYQNIKINTTFVLTQDLLDEWNKNNEFFDNFEQTYKTSIYFKAPDIGSLDKDMNSFIKRTGLTTFFPKRNDFLNFVIWIIKNKKLDILFNREYRAECLYENLGGDSLRIYHDRQDDREEGKCMPCGHLEWFSHYADSNDCMLCDINRLVKEFEDEE